MADRMKWLFGSADGFDLPLWTRAKWAAIVKARRTWRRLRPANATCDECGYRGRRTPRGIWCPSCFEDDQGELIRDERAMKWLILLSWWAQGIHDSVRRHHLTTDPACARFVAPRPGSRLDRWSRGLECEPCMVRRAFGDDGCMVFPEPDVEGGDR